MTEILQTDDKFKPAEVRLGRVFVLTTVALLKTAKLEPAPTAPEVEAIIPSVTSGVRRALQRMNGLYVPMQDVDGFELILETGQHPTKTWRDESGFHPSETYRLTQVGHQWATSLIIDLALNDWQKDKIRLEDHQLYQKA